jgi:hypothetical protein
MTVTKLSTVVIYIENDLQSAYTEAIGYLMSGKGLAKSPIANERWAEP